MTAKLSPAANRFLEWEEQQPERWEYLGGRTERLEDVTMSHDLISNDLRGALHRWLRHTDCHVHGSRLKVVTAANDILYPDAFVLCGRGDLAATVVDAPIIVFEVVSPTSAERDLTRKRLAYKTIPSLKAIIYIAQDRARIDVVRRQADGRWDDDEPVVGREAELALPEIGISLGMAAIYRNVDVEAA